MNNRMQLLQTSMNITRIFLLSLMFVVHANIAVFASVDAGISGEVRSGFRLLDVAPNKTEEDFTVYRGDYIKFRYPKEFGSLSFSMVDLNYSGTLLPDSEKAPFFKMKMVGNYGFRIGEGSGVIKVIDLVRPNYIEVTADQAAELLQNIDPFILDVRTPREYEQVHLKGTHLIPIQELQKRLGELEGQKHEDIFVYCATGNRSTVAAKILADAGFKRIYNLRNGVYDWAKKGYPYSTGK